jgi:PAS domain S-box-containing protein
MRASGDGRAEVGEPAADDPRVIAALEEYVSALQAGQAPQRQEFQARHPEIAAVLAECLEGLDWLRGAAPVAGVGPGTSLGEYRIVREVGRGGMGVVYEAEQLSLGRRVALKVLPFASTLDARHLQRFKNEAHAAAGLHHTNIVPVFAVGCERGVHYYAMQLIEGQTLAALISELRQQAGRDPAPEGGRLAPPSGLASRVLSEDTAAAQAGGDTQHTGPSRPEPARTQAGDTTLGPANRSVERSLEAPGFFRAVAQLGIQAAGALEHAHQLGVIHRDIKPGNLMVEGEAGVSTPGVRLWVTDFGLAHCQSRSGLSMTGDPVGTLRYMSPEQALATGVAIDHRTDIYSLGVTLYELLTLEPAFPGHDRQELRRQIAFEEPRPLWRLNRAIPTELEAIVRKAMAKNPAERYATAGELADDLQRFLKDEPIRASLLIQQALNAILRIALEPISLEEQMHRILDLILQLPWLALERKGSIYLADEGAKVLVRKAQVGMPAGALSACAQVPFGTCLCGQAIAAREIVFASCLDARHTTLYPGIVPHGHYCVPICAGERRIGLLTLYVREGHQRLPTEERFLRAVADVLAGVVERQRAEQAVRESEARKAAILETALDCIITIDHTGRIIEFNPAAEQTFGFRSVEVVGRSLAELLVPPALREQHSRGLARYLATGEGPVLNRRVEMPALRADGTEVPVELAVTRIASAGPPLFTAYLRDITDRKRLEQRRSARLALTQILGEAATLQEAAPRILQAVCEGLGWDVGAVWTVDRQAGVLRCVASWHLPSVRGEELAAICPRHTFPPGVGLPGRIWSSGRPAWIADLTKDAPGPGAPVTAPEGLHGAFGCPIWLGREMLGVLGFFSHEVREPDDDLLAMLATIGVQIGQFMQRREAENQLRRQEEDRRIARRIQEGLLPKAVPTFAGFQIRGRSAPAQDVGGDCFDFLPLRVGGEECLGVLVADASGHGISAALLVAQTRAYLRALALTCADVGTLLTLSNQRLAGDLVTDHFVTLFLLRLDPRTHSLLYASAGHCPGYVLDRQGQTRAVLASTGCPLGIDSANEFPTGPTTTLEPGDLVFLFTDGIDEAVSPDGEQFGLERTLGIVRAHQQDAPEAILDALFHAVGDFSGHQLHDDITAVIIKAEGAGS